MTQFDRTLKGKGVFSEKKIGGGVFSEYFFRSIFYKASEQILIYIYIYIYRTDYQRLSLLSTRVWDFSKFFLWKG
jgi:hypothetical protein